MNAPFFSSLPSIPSLVAATLLTVACGANKGASSESVQFVSPSDRGSPGDQPIECGAPDIAVFLREDVGNSWGLCMSTMCRGATWQESGKLQDQILSDQSREHDPSEWRVLVLVNRILENTLLRAGVKDKLCEGSNGFDAEGMRKLKEAFPILSDKARKAGTRLVSELTAFRADYPEDPKSESTLFTLGAVQFLLVDLVPDVEAMERRGAAIRAFEEQIAHSPQGEWAPAAWLALGALSMEVGDCARALGFFDAVLSSQTGESELTRTARRLREKAQERLQLCD
jgi:hypothetical protein